MSVEADDEVAVVDEGGVDSHDAVVSNDVLADEPDVVSRLVL